MTAERRATRPSARPRPGARAHGAVCLLLPVLLPILLPALGLAPEAAGAAAPADPGAPPAEVAAPEEGASSGGEAQEAIPSVAVQDQPDTLLEFAVAGGWLMVPIALSSVVWLAFLVERLIVLRRRRVIPRPVAEGMESIGQVAPLDRHELRVLLDTHPSSASSVLRAALERIHLPRDEIEQGVNTAAQREIYVLRRNIRLFAIVASVAPLLGLLGTVTGLIQAFREVAIQGLGSGTALAPGIYQALITTAAGLLVAIPALLTYYWMLSRVDQYVHEIDNLVVDFVDAQAASRSPIGSGTLGA